MTMFNVLKVIFYKLWLIASITLCSTIIVYCNVGGIVACMTLALGFLGIFFSGQDLLLYYPYDPPDSREFVLQPSNYKLPYESIKIRNKDGLLIHLFLIKQSTNSKQVPTMIFLHGNAGNMGQRLVNVSGLYNRLVINILMVEYRGFGLSEGTPTERGLYIDAQSALDYLICRPDINAKKIILFGRSLGGAVAIDLASSPLYKEKIWALIVENTFTSIPDMAVVMLRWRCMKWLPSFMHKNKYMSINKINKVVCSTLFICGADDTLVPPAMSKTLYSRCSAINKKIVVIPDGGHNDTWTAREYYQTLLQFLLHVPAIIETEAFYDDDNREPPANKQNIVHIV